jgi:signal transduction histidine kinase
MSTSVHGHTLRRINRQVWLMLVSQFIWMSLLFGFFTWWGYLLNRQALHIGELERAAGVAEASIVANLEKLNRIVFWEAGTMFLLVVLISLVILSFFLRDARRSRSVQTFFAGITHELRTPMTGIRLQAETIAEKTPDDAVISTLTKRLIEDTEQLESHLEQILELARIEGGSAPQIQTLNLEDSVASFLRQWQYTHGADRPLTKTELRDFNIQADPVALSTILRNLFDNSLRHGGREDISVSLRSFEQGKRIVLHYRDNGNGCDIDPAELGQVFLKGGASDGSGVGLYLICSLMRQIGGDVTFSNDAGFNVVLRFQRGLATAGGEYDA